MTRFRAVTDRRLHRGWSATSFTSRAGNPKELAQGNRSLYRPYVRYNHAPLLTFVIRDQAGELIMFCEPFDIKYFAGAYKFRTVIAPVDQDRQTAVVSHAN
jgi:hypothetical protein